MYRTLYFRYLGQEKYAEVLKLLYEGSVLLFDHEQNSSGADLAKLFVEVLHRCKAPIEVETVNRLATMLSRIPAAAPERQAFLVRAIAWSQLHNSESKKFEGHPKLHTAVADVYWKEADYQRARYHFMRSDDMLGLGRMLVEVQVELGYRSEIDLFAVQAVLQLLCLRDQANASRFFTAYTEQHPLLETQVAFEQPLLNFTRLLLLAIPQRRASNYAVLCERYQLSLKRDPTYRDYLDRVGQIYFGLPPPRSATDQGVLGNLIQTLMGNLEGDSESDDAAGPSDALHTSELD